MVVRRKTTEQFIQEAIAIHGNKYDYTKSVYVNPTTKICITCPKHGDFWQLRYKHIRRRKPCPQCTTFRGFNLTTPTFCEEAKKVHGQKYDYSKVQFNGMSKQVCIICPIHGEFLQTARYHLDSAGCSKCAQIKISGHLNGMTPNGQKSYILTTDEYIARARKVHGNRYDYSKAVYRNGKKNVEIICSKHGSFWKNANNHIRHEQGCPKCSLSKGELAIAVYLEKSAISYEMQKTFPKLVGKKGGTLRYDFYVPSRNILIEYDGAQHFGCRQYKGRQISQAQINNLQINDMAKEQYAYEHGISLVRIPFTQKNNLNEVLLEKVVNAPIVNAEKDLMSHICIPDGKVF